MTIGIVTEGAGSHTPEVNTVWTVLPQTVNFQESEMYFTRNLRSHEVQPPTGPLDVAGFLEIEMREITKDGSKTTATHAFSTAEYALVFIFEQITAHQIS
jgi:hypothetical protein